MEVTKKSTEIANSIVDVLAKEKCTIEQAQSILSYVSRKIMTNSTVQVSTFEISQEKLKWLKSINANHFQRPYSWSALQGKAFYSDEYLSKTPLEELKSKYEMDKECNLKEAPYLR